MTVKFDFTDKEKDMIEKHEIQLKCHEKRIRTLEETDIKLIERMQNVINNLSGMTSVLKWLATTIAGSILVFLIANALKFAEVI
jgi:hypothetical protein